MRFIGTRQQNCQVHKAANISTSYQGWINQRLHSMWRAETWAYADKVFGAFLRSYKTNYLKVAGSLLKDHQEPMTFHTSQQHWKSVCMNLVKPVFDTIWYRAKRLKLDLRENDRPHIMFKLGLCGKTKLRELRSFAYRCKVITRVKLKCG